MYRDKLPRVYELKNLVKNSASPNAYFQEFENKLSINEQMIKKFVELESALQCLDLESWDKLKNKVTPLLHVKDTNRGWHQLFDTLNEVHGYNYLKNIGCLNVKFIPRSKKNGIQTPDLEGILNGFEVLCEVKTINVSDDLLIALKTFEARRETGKLSEGFLTKFFSDYNNARKQLLRHRSSSSTKCIVYFVINFDNFTGEFDISYYQTIRKALMCRGFQDVEVEFHSEIKST